MEIDKFFLARGPWSGSEIASMSDEQVVIGCNHVDVVEGNRKNDHVHLIWKACRGLLTWPPRIVANTFNRNTDA